VFNFPGYKRDANQTTIRYHLTPIRMPIINGNNNNKCRRGCGKTETLIHCWWECKLIQPLWKAVWRFLKNLEILVLGIYP
jgi:hypothetical protein